MSTDLKKILNNLANEMDGRQLTKEFTLFNFKWEISLLNEEESNWRNAHLNTGNQLATFTSMRLATLAMAIRKINDAPVFAFFEEEWGQMTVDQIAALENMNKFARKYFAAEHLMEFLSQRFPEGVGDLYDYYQELEAERKEVLDASKKSSGENSETDEKPNTTEFSPNGDQS